jgi:membrane protease YdiL (CAAX protease family)
MFPRTGSNPRLSLSILAFAIALYIALVLLVVFVLFPSGILNAFAAPTRGLITATLVANFIFLAIIVGLVLCLVGGLRLSDLGLRGSDVPIAAVLTISVWIGVNAIEGAWQAVADGGVSWSGEWQRLGATALIGALLAQVFGNALYEEILFRGVVLRQSYWRLEMTRLTNLQALAIAIAVSQSLFALIHLPILLSGGMSIIVAFSRLPAIFVAGTAFAVLYARSDNLMLCVGIHALANKPTLLLTDRFALPDNLAFPTVMCLVLAALWGTKRMRTEDR